jgi:hypothetical protein
VASFWFWGYSVRPSLLAGHFATSRYSSKANCDGCEFTSAAKSRHPFGRTYGAPEGAPFQIVSNYGAKFWDTTLACKFGDPFESSELHFHLRQFFA